MENATDHRLGARLRALLNSLPIRLQMVITFTILIWMTVLILSFLSFTRQRTQLNENCLQIGEITLNYISSNSLIPLANDDILTLNKMIKDVKNVSLLRYAIIVDAQERIRAHTDYDRVGEVIQSFANAKSPGKRGDITYFTHTEADGQRILNMYKAVLFEGKAFGKVHVGISLAFIKQLLWRETATILFVGVLLFLVGIAIAIVLGINFSKPIQELTAATREIGQGNFDCRMRRQGNNEIGQLADAFNYMAKELGNKEVVTSSFGRFVSPEVVEMVIKNPNGRWLKGALSRASVLFTDIRGFTAFAEKNGAEEVVEYLNEYFEIATACILRHGGRVDKFVGDAVMAVFGVPQNQKDHALRAIQAGIDMQHEFKVACGQSKNPLLRRVGIGIDTGTVLAGALGSKVKMEYTVIGDRVNVAARITDLATDGEIIISNYTYWEVKEMVRVEELPRQAVKGKTEPIMVYRIKQLTQKTIGK